MILDAILGGFFTVFIALFNLFPNIPAMPSLIVDGWNWFLNAQEQAMGIIVYFLSPPLYIMILSLIIFMTTFHYIYAFFIRFLIFRIFMGFVGR